MQLPLSRLGPLLVALAPLASAQVVVDELLAADHTPNDFFGSAVALDGTRALVGAPFGETSGQPAGSAYVFELGPSGWTEVAQLVASDAAAGDEFGRAVALSGDRAVVGAPGDEYDGTDEGSVYVFERGPSGWSQTAKLGWFGFQDDDRYGHAVAIDGPRLAVGALSDGGPFTETKLYVLENDVWGWTRFLSVPASADDHFGVDVAIDGTRILIGADLHDGKGSDSGAAFVYELGPFFWELRATLTATDTTANDRFGCSVDLDGDVAIVGASRENAVPGALFPPHRGAAYVFERQGTDWVQTQKLPGPEAGFTLFGDRVAIEGDVALVGAREAAAAGAKSGVVHRYRRTPSGWVRTDELVAPDTVAFDAFGTDVALSDGRALVGSTRYDKAIVFNEGSAHVFDFGTLSGTDAPISVTAGGAQTLFLDAPPELAGLPYLVLGSVSGTAPPLLVDAVSLPLAYDGYTLHTLSSPNAPPLASSFGLLDAQGRANASFSLPPASNPSLAGLPLAHAYVVIDLAPVPYVAFASNAAFPLLVP